EDTTYPSATRTRVYTALKNLDELGFCKPDYRRITVPATKNMNKYTRLSPVWVYTPKIEGQEEKIRDPATERIRLIVYLDILKDECNQYVENCKSSKIDCDPDVLTDAGKLLDNIRSEIIADNIDTKKISNHVLEICKALDQLYELSEPFYLDEIRRELEEEDEAHGSPS